MPSLDTCHVLKIACVVDARPGVCSLGNGGRQSYAIKALEQEKTDALNTSQIVYHLPVMENEVGLSMINKHRLFNTGGRGISYAYEARDGQLRCFEP